MNPMGGRGSSSGTGGNGSSTGMTGKEALAEYQKEGYKDLNKKLRDDEELDEYNNSIKKGMDETMTTLDEEVTVYRGLGKTIGSQALPGSVIKDKGYVSTSRDIFTAKGFSNYVAKITLPKGTKSIDVNKTLGTKSKYKGEKEIVLPTNTKFGVTNINNATGMIELTILA